MTPYFCNDEHCESVLLRLLKNMIIKNDQDKEEYFKGLFTILKICYDLHDKVAIEIIYNALKEAYEIL